ncbi:alpha-ketoglutarate decarboxylase [Hanstruepera neustonica]|uniref:Alpha-ketoglutarate decarboxylase n=1 Tax=Hanstruepera neustonica TaxID=1445657 RepID=A0A2K1DVJ8_9FLAO|nr:alpha-ketoglutarate decarboxylase [Hanstruepera neustonica]PNQ72033.1 alpha-ketoglutarate decarboxylase [Hanstruepera neustonica]
MKKELVFGKLTILVLLFFLSFQPSILAQNEKSDFWNHVAIGGGIGLSFGSGFFSGTIAPSAIYRFNPQVAMGLGLNYTYNEDKDFYRSSIIGGSVIGFYNPIREVQLSAEFEQLNVNRNYYNTILNYDEDYWYPALFLGAGYSIITGKVSTAIGIRYDVLYDRDKSIYAEPWAPFIRVYF